jgi:hypothetical protein
MSEPVLGESFALNMTADDESAKNPPRSVESDASGHCNFIFLFTLRVGAFRLFFVV